jgi:hypothetical protein
MKFREFYNNLNKLSIIHENPDNIKSRKYPNSDKRFSYQQLEDVAYSVIVYECVGGSFKYVYKKDTTENGHYELRQILARNDYPEMQRELISDIPVDEIQDIRTESLRKNEIRIWTTNKIFSAWKPFKPGMINVIEELLRQLRQNPEEYIFEFDGATYNDGYKDHTCYTWEGLHKNKKLPSENNKDELAEIKREENKLMLAQIKMGIKPTVNKRVTATLDGD